MGIYTHTLDFRIPESTKAKKNLMFAIFIRSTHSFIKKKKKKKKDRMSLLLRACKIFDRVKNTLREILEV